MMRSTRNSPIMVPLVSFLAALRIFTEAQSCNNGLGRIAYEKIADVKTVSAMSNPEIIRRSGPPVKVLEECLKRCQEDKVTSIETCGGFDFKPGHRRSSPYTAFTSGSHPHASMSADYEDSQCTLLAANDNPDANTLAHSDIEPTWHFEEICISAKNVLAECPNRWYIFERIPGFKLNGLNDKEIDVLNRTECEDQCLNHTDLPCRSATFFKDTRKCILSRESRYINPVGFKADSSADYMENLCLKRFQACASTPIMFEMNKELDTTYEREITSAFDVHECSSMCINSLDHKGFICRSFSFDDIGRTCVLYEEDPIVYGEVGQDQRTITQDHRRPMKASSSHLYRILCDNQERDRSANSIGPMHPSASSGHPNLPPFTDHWRDNMASPGRSFGQAAHLPPFGAYGAGQSNSFSPRHPQFSPSYPESNRFASPNGLQFGASTQQGSSAGLPPPTGHALPLGHPFSGHPMMPPPSFGIPYHSNPPLPFHPNALGPGVAPFGAPSMMSQIERCQMQANSIASAGVRFNRIGFGSRLRSTFVTKLTKADRLEQCEQACAETRDFECKSFNFRPLAHAENCELSQYDTRTVKLDNPTHFEHQTQYDFYEKDAMSAIMPNPSMSSMIDCIEVAQSCTPDGMEFTVKTPEGFYGRIYTYGFYDSCFYDGNGGTVNVLRISRANGIPRCGTQQYGDAMTNIVVVQFNDYVQTSRDKKYNLTCFFSGPGEAVVTSSYLDAKTDGRFPTQIENLPAQNILTSNVVLRILYRGAPTNTIVVGDLLTFRLESRGHFRYDFYNSDIFATNVIAKDPITGRQVLLIDARGCPVDLYVFPELHRTSDGALEAEFYAFKIPDSSFLIFQATVKTCRGPCEPIICSDKGRGPGQYPSLGRRKRRNVGEMGYYDAPSALYQERSKNSSKVAGPAEEVHELFRVYMSRSDVPDNMDTSEESTGNHHLDPESSFLVPTEKVCLSSSGYYTLVTCITILVTLLLSLGFAGVLAVRKGKKYPQVLHHRS